MISLAENNYSQSMPQLLVPSLVSHTANRTHGWYTAPTQSCKHEEKEALKFSRVTLMSSLCYWNQHEEHIRTCVVIIPDWSIKKGNGHQVLCCHEELWIQLPEEEGISSSFAPTDAEKPKLQLKQRSAVGCLQELCSAVECFWISDETRSSKTSSSPRREFLKLYSSSPLSPSSWVLCFMQPFLSSFHLCLRCVHFAHPLSAKPRPVTAFVPDSHYVIRKY